MSIVEFHEADDTCVPFPHRVITVAAKVVKVRGRSFVYKEHKFIICATCDHWVTFKPMAMKCDCEQKCHQQGEILGALENNGTIA